jgi:SpoVK/Ycf46/Vps4 family AAA+-type ATPase
MAITEVTGFRSTDRYQTSLDHILDELNLIAFRLQSWTGSLRRGENPQDTDKFRGLYISDKEIDDILENPNRLQFSLPPYQKGFSTATLNTRLEQLREGITARKHEAEKRGVVFRLDFLSRQTGLSRFEIDTLLVCLLTEIDLRYQKLYAFLQDDITRKSPTVDFILHLLCDTPQNTLDGIKFFSPGSPLLRYRLISFDNDHSAGTPVLLARTLKLDERIVRFLLGEDRVDSRLARSVHLIKPAEKLEDAVFPEDMKGRLLKLIARYRDESLICCLSGPSGTGKRDTAEAVCATMGIPLLVVDARSLTGDETSPETSPALVFREGILHKAAVYLEDFGNIPGENSETKQVYEHVTSELLAYPGWVIIATEKGWRPGDTLAKKPFVDIELSPVSYMERKKSWEKISLSQANFTPNIDLDDLAGKFRFDSIRIRQAVTVAANLARWRDPDNGQITGEDLYNACRKLSRDNLITLAHQINPSYHWEDIVLPRDQVEQLHEICMYVQYYHTVYGDWGFGRKISLGKGLNALFAGVSGTGKTMAADVIANALKIDLYKIDLSAIVSKYIGETEKNLDRIFREGQASNAILFFDEADALFGKRSEVRDSHDRYANIEIAYLLQKMDEYDGVVILATNLRNNIDEAFARRMHFTIEFPMPEEADRLRIWQGIFPREMPVGNDVDLKFMSRQFKITGGNIKNIAVSAAFLAAEDGRVLKMENLIHATKREYQKIGKLCTQIDFAQYFDLVKG